MFIEEEKMKKRCLSMLIEICEEVGEGETLSPLLLSVERVTSWECACFTTFLQLFGRLLVLFGTFWCFEVSFW